MSPAGQRLWSSIAAARRRVRRDGVLAAAGVAAAMIPATLVAAWALGATPAWLAPSPVPLILVGLALVAVGGLTAWAVRRWVLSVDDLVVASAAEARRGLPAGSVRGVLELSRALPAGASPSLYTRAEMDLARQLAGATTVDLSGSVGELARRRRVRCLVAFGGLGLLAAVLGFVSPERTRMGWGALMSPVAHLSPPPMPALIVEPGDVELPRGAHLDVAVQAPGRREVTLRWRAAGDVPRQRHLSVENERASTRLSSVDAAMVYWVISPDGAVSDTFRVTPLDPLLFSDLVVDVVYPSYLGRQPERFEDEVPPLEVPAGTELRFRGRATRELQEAALHRADGSTRVDFEVAGDRFSGRWTPRTSGAYAWALADRRGGPPASTPPPLELTVVADSAPQVEITFPGPDTLLGPEMRQAVVADARDDHGLHTATLVSWRVSALGGREAPVEQRVDLQGDAERAILRTLIDARERRLLPGDELHYFVRVVDASPMRQVGESDTHVLRLPSLTELRQRADEQAEALVDEASDLAQSAREMEESTRDLARQAARSSRGGSSGQSSGSRGRGGNPGGQDGGEDGGEGSLDYEQREQARHALAQQESMIERVERMRERTQALQRAMEAAGLQDPALQSRLTELQQLYDQILTPELKEKMEELRNSIDEMDPEEAQQALEQLAEQQEELRRRVDQSLELLRRAALEQQMNAAAQEARELAAQQEALADAISEEGQPSPERAQQQEELADRANALRELMRKLQQQLSQQGEEQTASQTSEAGKEMDSARQAMQQAAEQARQQQGQQAGESGKQAAQQLEQAAQSLESARESMAEGWRNETQEAVEQAANDALELAQRQNELLEQMRQAQQSGHLNQSMPQPQQGQQQGQQQNGQGSQQGQQGQQGQQSGQQGGQQGQQGQQGQGKQGQGKQGEGQQGQGQQGQGQSSQSGEQSQPGEQGQSQGQPSGQGQPGGGQQGGGQQGGSTSPMQTLRQQQAALQQSLEALGRNLAETGRRSAMVNPDVGAALSRAALSMQQTLEAMQGNNGRQAMPMEEARQTVEALNRLALELLENGEEIEQSESGTGVQQALEQLAELAKQQGSLNGQANSLLPMGLGPQAMADRMERMARQQRDLAKKLGGMNDMVGGQDDVLGQLDELAREAEAIAQELSGGRLTQELLARQERLFHRLLDAGRTLEREEYTNERVGERPGNVGVAKAPPLDAELLYGGPRYPVPDAEALRDLPPAYRRLILEYFDRLNRQSAPEAAGSGAGSEDGPRDSNRNR